MSVRNFGGSMRRSHVTRLKPCATDGRFSVRITVPPFRISTLTSESAAGFVPNQYVTRAPYGVLAPRNCLFPQSHDWSPVLKRVATRIGNRCAGFEAMAGVIC